MEKKMERAKAFKKWQDRITQEVKDLVDVDLVAEAFKRKWESLQEEGWPANRAAINARRYITELLKRKGVNNAQAVHLLHVCEVLPYSGCGCCEHRK